jgi:hypothetical protein
MQLSYGTRKTGEDLLLGFTFKDSRGYALPLSACTVTIRSIDSDTNVVDDAVATLVADGTVQYRWSPTVAGKYLVEWHAVWGDGIDVRSPAEVSIKIVPRIGTAAEFVAGPSEPTPTVLPYLHIPGEYEVGDGAAVGDLVAITGAGVATTFATRGDEAEEIDAAAADAVVLELISPTLARLGSIATLDAFTGLTPGGLLYLGLDGAVTHTATSTAGELHQLVGRALTTTRAQIDLGAEAFVLGRKAHAKVRELEIEDGAGTVDCTAGNIFAATVEITEATALTLAGGQEGDLITVHLVQDATGYAVTVVAAGRTVVYMEGAIPTDPSKAVDLSCSFVTVAGVPQVRVHSAGGA